MQYEPALLRRCTRGGDVSQDALLAANTNIASARSYSNL